MARTSAVDGPEFDSRVDRYARPGAFEATSNWYRVGAGYVDHVLDGIGHFTPLEAPADFAGIVQLALGARIG
jgi:pimeloyl-ACP methyl ester carboxylesterase